MKKIFFIFLMLCTLPMNGQIKTAVYWTAPTLVEGALRAKDNLLILDLENLKNNPEIIKKLKIDNPDLKILIYSNPMEIWSKETNDRPLMNKFRLVVPKEFLLKTSQGKNVVFWPNMLMMNMSADCPKIKGKNYVQYYADWLLNNILNDSLNLIDGYFQDNSTATIDWVNPMIDGNNDKKPDQPLSLNNRWRTGMVDFIKLIRQAKGNDFIIITNKGEKSFFFLNNGVMFERFPNDYLGSKLAKGWYQCLLNASQAGPYTVFQVDYNHLEFGVASSLLLDNVFIAVGQNMQIPEKFRIPTGKPLGQAYQKNGLHYRDYEFITVEVNPVTQNGRLVKRVKTP